MSATSREIVLQTLEFKSPPRAARDLWTLPIAAQMYAAEIKEIQDHYPSDFIAISGHERTIAVTKGAPYEIGEFTDAWGCTFENIQRGIIGEVKTPMITDWRADRSRVHLPREWLTIDRDAVNRDCATTDKFCVASSFPRPFEQLQFLRGSENLYMDLLEPPEGLFTFIHEMHAFYCELLEEWAKTDVDALFLMDDWGSQRALLVAPDLWRKIFRPLYRDYAQIAHSHGKKLLMHSDGHIVAILPDLIEIGVDAVNSQLFCMGVENLAAFAGKITFWGEIDRQQLLPHGTPDDITRAVASVHRSLWRNGGCIAQCEFGPSARAENVRQVFVTWDQYTARNP